MITALVLAAGRSRRMGQQKLLLAYRGQPMIAHVVDQLLDSTVDRVWVVVGPDNSPIVDALAGRDLQLVINPAADAEMLDSVRCGLHAMPQEVNAVVVALGDQPTIRTDVVSGLIDAYQRGGHGIAVPTHGGQRGHPLLVSMQYRVAIQTRFDRLGLRGLLDAYREDVLEFPTAAEGILSDIDTPEDYQHAVNRADP